MALNCKVGDIIYWEKQSNVHFKITSMFGILIGQLVVVKTGEGKNFKIGEKLGDGTIGIWNSDNDYIKKVSQRKSNTATWL